MRKFTVALIASILAGCGQAQSYAEDGERVAELNTGFGSDDAVYAVRDDKRGVTCYVYKGYRKGGIFCLTDAQLQAR